MIAKLYHLIVVLSIHGAVSSFNVDDDLSKLKSIDGQVHGSASLNKLKLKEYDHMLKQKKDRDYFNVLNLDGKGWNSFCLPYFL